MGRIGVVYQDVVSAIPKLQAQGKSISVDNTRAELGRGSKSTIARLLREWKAQQGLPMDDDASLPSDLLTAVKELWRLLQTKADDVIAGYREEYDVALREIQQQLNQYKAKDTEWKDRVHALWKRNCINKLRRISALMLNL